MNEYKRITIQIKIGKLKLTFELTNFLLEKTKKMKQNNIIE